jgi:hypothetical protein
MSEQDKKLGAASREMVSRVTGLPAALHYYALALEIEGLNRRRELDANSKLVLDGYARAQEVLRLQI